MPKGIIRPVYRYIKSFFDGMAERRLGIYAATSAFFMILSIIPLLLLVCTILSRLDLSPGQALDMFDWLLPEDAVSILYSLIESISRSSSVVLPISLVISVWSAGKGVYALLRGVRAAYDSKRVGYMRNRLMASLITLLLVIVFVAFMAIVFLVGNIRLPQVAVKVLVIIAACVLISLFYMRIPGSAHGIWSHLPGAVISMIAAFVFTSLYRLYILGFGRYSGYGTFGTIIVTMLWIYYMMYIILAGAFFNRHLELIRKREIEL